MLALMGTYVIDRRLNNQRRWYVAFAIVGVFSFVAGMTESLRLDEWFSKISVATGANENYAWLKADDTDESQTMATMRFYVSGPLQDVVVWIAGHNAVSLGNVPNSGEVIGQLNPGNYEIYIKTKTNTFIDRESILKINGHLVSTADVYKFGEEEPIFKDRPEGYNEKIPEARAPIPPLNNP